MDPHLDTPINNSRSSSPESVHSNASTVSCSETHGTLIDEQQASEELSALQEELQNVLEDVDQGMILKSFDTLSRLTDIVVTNCEKLGLTTDSSSGSAIDQKAGFWNGLNNCWLFAFSHHNNARSEDQRLREPHLYHLHSNIKAWADVLEKYGLVNYELGLRELDILDAIELAFITTVVVHHPSSSSQLPNLPAQVEQDNQEETHDGNQ